MEIIDYQAIQSLDDPLIIDVRSPSEFTEDHLPTAINLPVLDDAQRDKIGTLYNQQSTFLARHEGAKIICDNLPEILQTIHNRSDETRPIVVYCWRGGMRSESLSLILDRIGYPTYQLSGGYKSYRQRVHQFFQNRQWNRPIVTIYSLTGCGKTKLLHGLQEVGQSVVDLEAAANHRGSAFGLIGREKQPSQKAFENDLYQQFQNLDGPIYLEGESRHIGRLRIPDPLFDRVTSPPRVWMETDTKRRVEIIFEEYEWPNSRKQLIEKLNRLRERMGNNTINQLQSQLKNNEVRSVIRTLLEEYYDPAYRNSCPERDQFDLIINGNDLDRAKEKLTNWSQQTLTV